MALSAVKATTFSSTSGTTVTATALTATSGSGIIVGAVGFLGSNSAGANSATRTGDTYTADAALAATAGASTKAGAVIYSAPNVGTGANDLVVSMTGANGISAFGLEAGGMPTSSIKDANSPALATGSGTTATSNSLTNATANAIFVDLAASESSANPATVTKDAAYTDTVGGTTMSVTDGSTSQVAGMSYRIVSATGAQTPAYTLSSANWGKHIAVYKASGAGPTPTLVDMIGHGMIPVPRL